MDVISSQYQRWFRFEIRRLVFVIGMVVAIVLVLQPCVLPYGKTLSGWLASGGSMVGNVTVINHSKSSAANDLLLDFEGNLNGTFEKLEDGELRNDFTFRKDESYGKGSATSSVSSSTQLKATRSEQEQHIEKVGVIETGDGNFNGLELGGGQNRPDSDNASYESFKSKSGPSKSLLSANLSSIDNVNQIQPSNIRLSDMSKDNLTVADISKFGRWDRKKISISQMNSLLLQSQESSYILRPWRSSKRDRELISAKLQIKSAPFLRNTPGLEASIFRNASTFLKSYKLMERTLKIYIYKEGEKPVFHQPYMRGIYASEGWFMKLIERNKNFIVRDPRKAHLFYLPFSVKMLREHYRQNLYQRNLEHDLKNYVVLIASKYRFWNRTGGADHFLVGCHDWAPQLTRQYMKNCIRALCNANVARGFKIGMDTTLPVTYIRSSEAPLEELGGRPPLERSTLAFFAGSMHGYLRPTLLKYWGNKEPDMKFFGPLSRDIEGKRLYREYMKSSKYCICARGYEVHTPRVVEAIFYECVPVIIADNYVPPFFEVLNWESFSVFIQEKDIPNLRTILLSIPQEKYLLMQSRVKMVQKHFLWHKNPMKYDLFHITLHSIWYNRLFQLNSK